MIPNKIVLEARGRHEEYQVGSVDVYPGMLVELNSSKKVIAHASQGGPALVRVVKEEPLRGLTKNDPIPANDYACPVHEAVPGDVLLMLLKNGQNVVIGDGLMSSGDGFLISNPGMQLANIVAPSTTITNLGTETTFSNGSYSIPANSLAVGDVIRIRAKAFLIAVNSTNTHRVRLYINSTTLADSGAIAMVANDYVAITAHLTIRSIGVSGTFVASGIVSFTIAGTATNAPFTIASTTLDTTAAAVVAIKSLASATSAGNQIRLDEFSIDLMRDQGLYTLARAQEAIDNSLGGDAVSDAAFIRVKTL